MVKLGEIIYKSRTAKNWSQNDLADALEVSRQSVSKWENDSAVPDLAHLIKMAELFGLSLDEMVFGRSAPTEVPAVQSASVLVFPPTRIIVGVVMMMFGMIFFLLSIFWGDHLAIGEQCGELISSGIVLVSLALLATYHFKIWVGCAIVYFLYTVACFAVFNVVNVANYIFIAVMGVVLWIWFLSWGMHNTTRE